MYCIQGCFLAMKTVGQKSSNTSGMMKKNVYQLASEETTTYTLLGQSMCPLSQMSLLSLKFPLLQTQILKNLMFIVKNLRITSLRVLTHFST